MRVGEERAVGSTVVICETIVPEVGVRSQLVPVVVLREWREPALLMRGLRGQYYL